MAEAVNQEEMAEAVNMNHHHYNVNKDRLTSLPYELLINILSRLSITTAATTAVLSHRFRHLWTHLTSFHFPANPSTTTTATAAILPHIFRQLTSPSLTAIHINLSSLLSLPNPNSISSLFAEISRRNIDHLTFNAMNNTYDIVPVPSSLFNSQSLVTLVLSGELVFDSPAIRGTIIHPPRLNKLVLKNLVLFSSDWLGNLIRSCALLEHLDLMFDFHPSHKLQNTNNHIIDEFEIFGLNLKSLNIELYCPFEIRRPRIYINAPKLTNLDICDCISLYYLVEFPTSLADVRVDIRDYYDVDTMWLVGDENYLRQMSKFVRGLSAACSLGLHVDGGTNLFPYLHSVDDTMPVFCNLTRVDIMLEGICYNYWTDVLLLLQWFPNLEHFAVKLYGDPPIPILPPQNWRVPDFVPHCLSCQLKTITISGFFEIDFDLELVAYILRSALVLEELHVRVYFKEGFTEEARLLKQCSFCRSLFKLPRASSVCEVVFTGPSITASSNSNSEKHLTCNMHLESWVD